VNKGYRGKYLPSMHVGDGVCDCCDGSDEAGGRAKCGNTCEVDGAAWRAAQAEGIRKAEEGARKRLTYAAEGQEAARARKGKMAELAAKVEAAKGAVAAAEAAVAAAEAEERAATEAARATGGGGGGSGGGPDGATAAALGITAAMDRGALLSLLLEHTRETGTSDKLVALMARKVVAGSVPGTEAAFVPAWVDAPPAAAVEDVKTAAGDAARTAAAAAKAEEGRVSGELASLKEEDGADYGPDAAFYKLKGVCADLSAGAYKYTVCPFGRATQDGTHLGTFSGWKAGAGHSVMQFTGGQGCWNGPARSVAVTLECGLTEALLAIDEPEKCTYAARMSTPAACDDRAARELRLELDTPPGGTGHEDL
jgi:protein kinase C substrate 80K-H